MIINKLWENKIFGKYAFIYFFILVSMSLSASPMAKKGVLDLSQWDFSVQGNIELKGQWEFYWSELLEPSDFINHSEILTPQYLTVPQAWNSLGGKEETYVLNGFGTYRLELLLPSDAQHLGLKITHIYSNYKIWANGELMHELGVLGINKSEAAPRFQNQMVDIGNQNEKLELIIQVSNFHVLHGGIANPVFLGSMNSIEKLDRAMNYLEIFLLGMFFIFAFYHIILFFLNKKDRAPLFFSILCMLIALRLSVTGENVMSFFFNNIDFIVIKRLEFSVITLAPFCFLFFLKTLISKFYIKLIDYYLIIILPLTTVLFTISPIDLMYRLLVFGQLNLLISVGYFCYIMIRASMRKNHNAFLLLIGNAGFFGAVIVDLIIFYTHIYYIYVSPLGLVFFFIMQSYILAKRNANAFISINKLTESLRKYSSTLEQKVENRTAKLKEQNQQRTNFFVNFSHEIKTPLTLIYNYLEKDIQNRGSSPEIAIVERNLLQLKSDVCNYLDIEKMIAGKSIYNHGESIDASFLTREIAELFQSSMNSKQINFTTDIDANIYILIDSQAYIRIVRNLLDNALAYSDEGGEVKLVLRLEEKRCFLEVSDSGVGIAEDEFENIFKSFYQISRKKKNYHGFGMGLSIIKMILHEIDGTIHVESKLGEGSRFIVSFPLASENTKPCYSMNKIMMNQRSNTNTTATDLSFPDHREDKKYVMIVEDNREMLQYLIDALGEYYNILFACNGVQALEILNTTEIIPDLILSDIMMESMDGFELYEAIEEEEELKNIPFVFLTAKSTTDDRLEALNRGAVDLISKPFDVRVLRARIDALIKNRYLMKDYIKSSFLNKLSVFLDDKKERNDDQVAMELNLTPREKIVAQYMMKGLQNKEIAATLHLSESGVKKHVKNIYSKCGVSRKADFLRFVHRKYG